MAAVKPDSAKTKPSTNNEKLGLHCNILNHALHSGDVPRAHQIIQSIVGQMI